MIQKVIDDKLAVVAANGCLATWTPPESTGRSPKDTVIVRRPENESLIDWDSPNNLYIDPETFETTATRMIDAGATREVVHVFEYGTIDRSLQPAESKWEPDLTTYRRVAPLLQAPPVSAAE